MRHRRTKAELAQGPVICANCHQPTDTPRRDCCPSCYGKWLRCKPDLVEQRFKGILQAVRRLDTICAKYAA